MGWGKEKILETENSSTDYIYYIYIAREEKKICIEDIGPSSHCFSVSLPSLVPARWTRPRYCVSRGVFASSESSSPPNLPAVVQAVCEFLYERDLVRSVRQNLDECQCHLELFRRIIAVELKSRRKFKFYIPRHHHVRLYSTKLCTQCQLK